jgi:hypothetical protein|tara:strand:+ start:55 stop:234 length:180 start_codon:yes stop_codon:yes gene_type:complete
MKQDVINHIDGLLMFNICMDIQNGTLLTQEDDETVEMVMLNMYDDMTRYEAMGLIIGKT